MAATYQPDVGAVPDDTYSTVFLSQRDLSLAVPVNYLTYPAVSLTRACFGHNEFEDSAAASCISNLLASGFRRLEVDLYWDDSRRVWSFCPVNIPSSVPGASSALLSSTVQLPSSPSSASLAVATLKARQQSSSASPSIPSRSSIISSTTQPSNSSFSTSSALPSFIALPSSHNESRVQIGPYICTTTINLSMLISLLLDYFQPDNSGTNIEAHLVSVVLNIHAGASASSPAAPAPVPASLPEAANQLNNLWAKNLSSYIYTPSDLIVDRSNLNNSFYRVSEFWRPANDYYETTSDANDIVSTRSGWPSEYYIQFIKSRRMLLTFGTIDPQMGSYNISGDLGGIFPTDYIQDNQPQVTATRTGNITSGCFLVGRTEYVGIANVNNSWATVANVSSYDYSTATLVNLNSLAGNLTDCGISSILNVTLMNKTAHEDYAPYQTWTHSTVWSWDVGQPRNYSSSADAESESLFRCAATSQATGRWSVADCSRKYNAACRATNQPYNWTVSNFQISYSYADQACPLGYQFAAPRTAMENSYLTQALRATAKDDESPVIFVDFNSLSVPKCWVVGKASTCPWEAADPFQTREIVVPSVAALIVLVVTGLTVFAKMAGNRKIRKRTKKRANNGFVYEGVPS